MKAPDEIALICGGLMALCLYVNQVSHQGSQFPIIGTLFFFCFDSPRKAVDDRLSYAIQMVKSSKKGRSYESVQDFIVHGNFYDAP